MVSDNKLVDGMAAATIEEVDSSAQALADGSCAVVAFAGLSKKGYAPYNPRKKNQDAMVIKYDGNTQSLLLCVFDGHGEAGDGVSGAIRDRFATELFAHAKFERSGNIQQDAESLRTAITDTLRSVEQTVLRDPNIDTEFSGTTAVVTVVRDNLVVVGNVGDSRITRGFVKLLGPSGPEALGCQELSIDHKPDRPDEKARIIASGGRVFAVEYDDGIDGPPVSGSATWMSPVSPCPARWVMRSLTLLEFCRSRSLLRDISTRTTDASLWRRMVCGNSCRTRSAWRWPWGSRTPRWQSIF